MAGLVKLLVAQGYHDIREVELEGDKFEVETLDAQGQRVRLQVDAHTGDIKKRPTRPLFIAGCRDGAQPASCLPQFLRRSRRQGRSSLSRRGTSRAQASSR